MPLLYFPLALLRAARSILPIDSRPDFSDVGEPGGCEPASDPSMTLPREVKRCSSFVELVRARFRTEGRRGGEDGGVDEDADAWGAAGAGAASEADGILVAASVGVATGAGGAGAVAERGGDDDDAASAAASASAEVFVVACPSCKLSSGE